MTEPIDENGYTKEQWEHIQFQARRAHDRHHQVGDQITEATINNGHQALRALMLINGGAAVALLAFVGALVSQDNNGNLDLVSITNPLMWFAWGVALAVTAIGLGYFANYCTSKSHNNAKLIWVHPFIEKNKKSKVWGKVFVFVQILTYIAGIGSLLCFVRGMYDIRTAIQIMEKSCAVNVPWTLIFGC